MACAFCDPDRKQRMMDALKVLADDLEAIPTHEGRMKRLDELLPEAPNDGVFWEAINAPLPQANEQR